MAAKTGLVFFQFHSSPDDALLCDTFTRFFSLLMKKGESGFILGGLCCLHKNLNVVVKKRQSFELLKN